jgi:hypothetical protein
MPAIKKPALTIQTPTVTRSIFFRKRRRFGEIVIRKTTTVSPTSQNKYAKCADMDSLKRFLRHRKGVTQYGGG